MGLLFFPLFGPANVLPGDGEEEEEEEEEEEKALWEYSCSACRRSLEPIHPADFLAWKRERKNP